MIEEILPDVARSEELFHDPDGAKLFPEEETVISRAVAKRRNEFTSARLCARKALTSLGYSPVPLVPGERGAPSWPDGVVGSMTHCAGYRAAALAKESDLSTIGIDAEPSAPLPDGVLEAIIRPEESDPLRRLGENQPDVHWDRLLFSAKESVYKAWFPLTKSWLGFEDASIEIAPTGTFSARFMVTPPEINGTKLYGFDGRWLQREDLVITAIGLSACR